ncbi:MAG: beta-lactamase family protein [Vicinamibacterales bacterium]|jgi:CubicO group peptidase (beta-lactamase class C family)|nr:beta-lactamase family protein [Vicinamibacterales bacterium]
MTSLGRPRRWAKVLVTVLVVAGQACQSSPAAPGTGGTDGAQIDAAFSAAAQEPRLRSLVVARDGAIVREAFFNGGGPDSDEYVWSVTKSMLALTVGLALDRGCLRSLDRTIGELLGPATVSDPEKAAITLRHLLTMSSGLDFPETAFYGTGASLYQAWVTAPDQVAWVLARPMTAAPGARFEYGSGTIHLASVALTRACGMRTSELADSDLFGPLGLAPRRWEVDHQGYSNGGAGLYLTPRDMQALGHLVLNGGAHRQRQVVSASYVAAMTSAQIATGSGMATPLYGFGWWAGQTGGGSAYTLANGWGGQFILVVPAKRLVVTTAALTTGLSGTAAMAQWQRIFDLLMLRIVPAF